MRRKLGMGAPGSALVLAVVVVLSACGDATTSDARGYTKAPLERPGLVIKSEPRTSMDELGDPILPGPAVERGR